MNDLLLKGPDVLNPIRAVLLRFRRGVYAALGDIKKMYNSVWLEEREMHLHRFLWRDKPEEDIKEYAITRVNIGDRPAGCIAQLAMRETARLSIFAHLKEECRILEEDSYVDDILTSHNSLEELIEITQGVEDILKAGGFFLKPWVWSGQSGRQVAAGGIPQELEAAAQKAATIILPNQMRAEDNKALGVGYQAEEDMLYMMTSINFSKRKRKVRLGEHLNKENVRLETPDPLSRRELLSQVAGLYDPIGLVTPVKQKGAILVRKAFQEAGGGKMTRETWDKPLSEGLREEAIKIFEEYVELGRIKFHRSITPADWRGKPWGITFSDGSDKTYGAVMYLRWDTERGVDVRFVEAKAKLTPLDQKGEAAKAEICGAVFAARLRKYFKRHGELNIADIMTRGSTARDLKEGSVWQNGPEFLKWPVEEWPKKSAGEVAAHAKESVNKFQSIQQEVSRFWRKWCELAGPNLFIKSKWHTKRRNVTVGDVVWLADQNALRGRYKLGRVVSVNPDQRGVVRDVNVRTFPSYPVPMSKGGTLHKQRKNTDKLSSRIPSTIVHRDVRRLVVLLPIEEQH
ncbi:uncharacterized protein LOC119786070 [Cyprinodon tularosa]|uniref:uncharacterized protein LOC119786070 n=1 Tax=Cyprinodon tularosa TaxID=77115 RepID=UPI0018E1FD57|nr:uncharacterized protein LOC119786070 [Cyprinodon tularosa]